MQVRLFFAAALLLAATAIGAQSASERRFIKSGQSEGEVLAKVGKPDHESVVSGALAAVVTKQWIYLPHADDAQTTTTITLTGGKVVEIERKVTR